MTFLFLKTESGLLFHFTDDNSLLRADLSEACSAGAYEVMFPWPGHVNTVTGIFLDIVVYLLHNIIG